MHRRVITFTGKHRSALRMRRKLIGRVLLPLPPEIFHGVNVSPRELASGGESRLIFTTDLGTLSLYTMKFRAYDFLAKFNSTDLTGQNFLSVGNEYSPATHRQLKILKVEED